MANLDTTPSNRAKWVFNLQPLEDGEPITITGASIVLEVRDPETKSIVLSATTDNGKILIESDILADFSETSTSGWFQVRFPVADMRTVCAGQYEIGCTIEIDDDEPDELFVGTVFIHDGIVS